MLYIVLHIGEVYLWVSGHETVDVVVDLLEDEASVHQVEAALWRDEGRATVNIHS